MKGNTDFDIIVIGGGIVGLASAYKITLNHPDIRVAVLEKENRLAAHQTGHNSGVIHSGLYYKPGSNKAKTCAAGRKELISFAKKYHIPYKICGKIIVATEQKELPDLEKIFRNGQQNNIEGIEKIGPDQIKQIEPFCTGIAGIKVPCTGVIDFAKAANKLAELIEKKGRENKVLTSHKVIGFDKHDFYTKVSTNRKAFDTKYIINCAGLQSDRIAKMDAAETNIRIVPFRGDYYELRQEAAEKVKNLIYPVPNPDFPFLGVHFTRMVNGKVECGPNAVFSFKREGYQKTDFSFRDTWDAITYPGLWKMLLHHWKYGLGEYKRAFSKKSFFKQLQRFIPSLSDDDIMPGRTGLRAQALGPDGELIDDFKIERHKNCIHVLNAPSPAATASLAIGDYMNQIVTEYFRL
jgi:L-2-hydroxyglutarate oxidase